MTLTPLTEALACPHGPPTDSPLYVSHAVAAAQPAATLHRSRDSSAPALSDLGQDMTLDQSRSALCPQLTYPTDASVRLASGILPTY